MNVAFDISPLESGHKTRGTGVYAQLLLDALKKYFPHHKYQLIHRGQNIPQDADIVHYPYFDPFFLTLPVSKPKPTVVTVHDLIPLVFPDKFPKGLRGRIKWQIQKMSLKGARRIMTDSQSSKKDIRRIVGFDERFIDVVRLAPAPVFKPMKQQSMLSALRTKYSLPEKFLMYVGDVNWNKNVPGLIRAFASATKNNTSDHISLVLVGQAFANSTLREVQEINRLIDALELRRAIIRPGYASNEDLAGMYTLATCLVQPSYYEGFGFPVLEAMASGCPVITSGTSSLAEIAGPALCIQPDKTESIASGIERMIHMSQTKKKELIQKGLTWSATFTWQRVATDTIASYERALA